jgi:hypothetical protein
MSRIGSGRVSASAVAFLVCTRKGCSREGVGVGDAIISAPISLGLSAAHAEGRKTYPSSLGADTFPPRKGRQTWVFVTLSLRRVQGKNLCSGFFAPLRMTYRKRFPISSPFPSRLPGRWIGETETDGFEGVKLGTSLPAGMQEQSAKPIRLVNSAKNKLSDELHRMRRDNPLTPNSFIHP